MWETLDVRKKGYDVSLFRKLSEDHPDTTLSLSSQYRMNESIMSIANHLVYQNQMQTACSDVSTSTLCLPCWEERKDSLEKWLLDCINPDKPVILLDTDLVGILLYSNVSIKWLNLHIVGNL